MIRALLPFALALSAAPARASDWTFGAEADALRAASCTGETVEPQRLSVETDPVPLGEGADLPDGISFAGGWALSSLDPRFGGLSGLDVTEDGHILALSDTGRAMRFAIPEGERMGALIWDLRHAEGRSLSGKLTGDAKGLSLRDGLAFVSFERDFRVLAFDMAGCGAAARGIPVAQFPARYGKARIRANAGPESLELTQDGTLRVGFEQPAGARVLSAIVMQAGGVRFGDLEDAATLPEGFRHVGADTVTLGDGRLATARLLRAYERRRGNRIILDLAIGPETPRITLAPPQTVDNFEGVALAEVDGTFRAFVISDDNFSDRQRTLLFAFDHPLD